MRGMVDYGHARGLLVGWYQNGCKCPEKQAPERNYAGDVQSLKDFGFDGVKLDDCGAQKNSTLYAQLMRESGKNFSIENHKKPEGRDCGQMGGASACPTLDWCPFNWYRSSHDINSSPGSWFGNLQTTLPFLAYEQPLSRPSCWAYPDMLEVGRVEAPDGAGTFFGWNRAHFGAWCIVSSPLILGMELSDAVLEPVLDIIGNTEAIAVNQAWAGHPGLLVKQRAPPTRAGDALQPRPPSPPLNIQQLWAKPLPRGGMAVLFINASPQSVPAGSYTIDFAELNMTRPGSPTTVRDVWKRADAGVFKSTFPMPGVPKFDSAFFTLSPRQE